ncbi:MAG: ArsA-related P-loop ATPase [Caldimonas sp.]
MEIKILGLGRRECRIATAIIERTARASGVEVNIVKVEKPDDIHRSGVQATPAVAIGGRVVHAGGLPSSDEVWAWLTPDLVGLLNQPTRHLFFTGKGGVGKTSLSTAAASHSDEMLGVELRNAPTPAPGAPRLRVLNILPDVAAESYRKRVLAKMSAAATETERSAVREQLSSACVTEIASFDEFASLLSDDVEHVDHIVFDPAPTGHTLRLLSLPKAWSEPEWQRSWCLVRRSALRTKDAEGALQGLVEGAERSGSDHRDTGGPTRQRRDRRSGMHVAGLE